MSRKQKFEPVLSEIMSVLGQEHEYLPRRKLYMPAKEGYCMKCQAKKEIKDPQEITMKNGRPATQGVCPDCGTKIFKIGK